MPEPDLGLVNAEIDRFFDEFSEVVGGIFDKIVALVTTDSSNKQALAAAVQDAENAKATLAKYDSLVASSLSVKFAPILEKAKEALTYASASTAPDSVPEVPPVEPAI